MLVFLAVVLGVATVGLQTYAWLRSGKWLELVALAAALAAGFGAGLPALRRVVQRPVYDMELVREKVSRPAYRVELRLAVFAPLATDARDIHRQLDRLAAAYWRYNLAAGNGFVASPLRLPEAALSAPTPIGARSRLPVLTTLELAGVWHLPHAAADVALLERTTARRWLPLPASVAEGCRIGVSVHQGRQVPVALPPDVLRRHLLLVAKTRRGKSSLMLRLAHHAMQPDDGPKRVVVLIDPHRDLADGALRIVPRERQPDVVFLDVANAGWPFGLNLLDSGLGWERERAVANALAVFQHEWGERHWGPRMEDAFRFSLLTLAEANAALCATDPAGGRQRQHTLLEVPALLSNAAFRRDVLRSVTDPTVTAWWSDYFEPLERRFQQELVNPVLTKIHRFSSSGVARHIVGQPASTIDPAAWLQQGRIVIVNTARGTVGDNASALIGSTLLNLVTLAVAEQQRLAPQARCPVSLFVDEFHTIPGADYEAVLSELGKYGANLVLATQSLARLLALRRDDGRGLRATVFANLDGLFAFNCSAEDAEYLVPELGGVIDAQDLVELGEHQCYARLSSAGQRLPTFSVSLDPPPSGSSELGACLASESASRFGRDVTQVVADRAVAAARVQAARAKVQVVEPDAPPKPVRTHRRPRKKRRSPAAA
jgi:Helicase HerA, central domain